MHALSPEQPELVCDFLIEEICRADFRPEHRFSSDYERTELESKNENLQPQVLVSVQVKQVLALGPLIDALLHSFPN